MNPSSKRQIAHVAKLLDGHRVLGERKGAPVVERVDAWRLRVRANTRLRATTSVPPAQSYLLVDRC
jgi:hypothetical protein